MSDRESLRRGYCPDAHHAMASGDGLIVRVRASSRALSLVDFATVLRVARETGSGIVEVTRRANLQLRGLSPASLPRAQAMLIEAGLVHPDPAVEARRVLVSSPLLPNELAVRELDDALSALPVTLTPKFGVVLDDARHALRDVAADLRIELGKDALIAHRSRVLGPVPREALSERIPWLVQRITSGGDVAAWGDGAFAAGEPLTSVGALPHGVGVGVPFGAAPVERWLELVGLAEAHGATSLRVSHRRGVTFPRLAQPPSFLARAEALGFIVKEGDPRGRLIACPGAPRCSSGQGETRALALGLSPRLPAQATLHVSGCEKGCAHSGVADVTLVRTAEGTRLAFGQNVAYTAAQHPLDERELAGRLEGHFTKLGS